MKCRKNRIAYCLLTCACMLALVAFLAGCGSGQGGEQSEEPASEVESAQPETEAEEVAETETGEFPSSYDLREQGLVTPVKLQNPWGSCWAFGGIAAAESSIISAADGSATAADLDLSEKHLTWFGTHPITAADDEGQAGEGIYLMDESDPNGCYETGGNSILVANLLASGVGPVTEADFPYRGANATTTESELPSDPEELQAAAIKSIEDEGGNIDDYIAENYPDMSRDEALVAITDQYRETATESNSYASDDDWTLPETDEEGASVRNVMAGFTLIDANFLPEFADRGEDGSWQELSAKGMEAVKSELMAGHAVSVGVFGDAGGENAVAPETYAEYVEDDSIGANHEVCIVGWDDDYPVENFIEDAQPPAPGAWLVKNSWGSETDAGPDDLGNVVNKGDWGYVDDQGLHTGYFWLSYYDHALSSPVSYAFDYDMADADYIIQYQYDYLPSLSDESDPRDLNLTSGDEAKTASMFTAESAFDLQSVTTMTGDADAHVHFEVYLLDKGATAPDQGQLVAEVDDDAPYKGFHRYSLPEPARIEEGQSFSVVACTSYGEGDDTAYEIHAVGEYPKETAAEQESPFYTVAVCNEGESFLYTGGQWEDWAIVQQNGGLGDLADGNYDNFRIKAFGTPAK